MVGGWWLVVGGWWLESSRLVLYSSRLKINDIKSPDRQLRLSPGPEGIRAPRIPVECCGVDDSPLTTAD